MTLSLILAACSPEVVATSRPTATDPAPVTSEATPALVFDGPAPTRVWMISIDTLRKDHFGRYGGPGVTPFFDRLMEEGVVADDHVQCSNWTWHSTSCTLAGRYAEDVGHLPTLSADPPPLPEVRTLARILSEDYGYGTVLASMNAWLGPKYNNAQGYQLFNPGSGGGAYAMIGRADYGISELTLADPELPWLAHSHFLEPHSAYVPPASYLEAEAELEPVPFDLTAQSGHYAANAVWPSMAPEDQDLLEAHLRVRYEGELYWMNDQFEAAFTELDARGRLDDTLVVVWTDHGEAFWEHGVQTHAHHLYAEENDAILFFWAKNLRPGTWSRPTTAVDVVPTILSVLGIPPDADMPGYPVGLAPDDRPIFVSTSARQGGIQGVIHQGWKLLYHWRDGRLELFDRQEDPTDTHDLSQVHPDVVLELWDLLEPRVDRAAELVAAQQAAPD